MRHNETTQAAAVLSHLREGDRQAAVVALMQLWLEEPERPDTIDSAASDTWQAIVEAKADGDAIAAGLALVRAGKRIRRYAYIELTERVSNDVLVELAELVLAARWNIDPYLAAVFLRLAERVQERLFFELLARHRERFRTDPALWELVLVVLSTSRIGDNSMAASWFADWTLHTPRMWTVAAYAATLFEGLDRPDLRTGHLRQFVEISTRACASLAFDETAALFVCFKMIGDLQQDRVGEFLETLQTHRGMIRAAIGASRLSHPIVRFANALKHADPVVGAQLDAPRTPHTPSFNRRLAYTVFDLTTATASMFEAIEIYAELHAAPRGDRRSKQLVHQMAALDRVGAGGWFRTAWARLVRQRTTWLQRAWW